MTDVPLSQESIKSPWLKLARDAYESSTSYLDANYRKQWERNISLFQSQHPSGSKYHSGQYQHRSRLFRPKTRSSIRTNEAAVTAAFFATEDVVSVYPQNDSDPEQRASATILKHLLQFRLTKTIPWFQTLVAAYQEALVFGSVVSHQYWEYKEIKSRKKTPVLDEQGQPVLNEDGTEAEESQEEVKIIKDCPYVRLIASENFRIDPAADWNDPVNSSPFVIEVIPMYLQDVLEKMRDIDPKTEEPKWKHLEIGELLKASKTSEFDSTRQTRQGKRQDPIADRRENTTEYTTIFIHKNIVRKNGRDWVYYTAGTEFMLTDPKPLADIYPHLRDGERPYVMGNSVIEAHKVYPTSLVELTQDLQTASNDIANQRSDNVQLVLNKRYHIRRSANIDIHALKRSVPGGSVMMDDPMTDVQMVPTPDVTNSSYEEQDRLNIDFDDIAGNFSQGSVQSNRMMNETVGGMEMLSSNANSIMEYMIRTFAETWLEPVIMQLIRLEQYYETDEVALTVAANRAEQDENMEPGYYQRFTGEDTDDLLRHEMTVGVNVGTGATDPVRKIERLLLGIRTMGEINPDIISYLNQAEVTKEVFGALGYKDAKRFIAEEEQTRLMEMQGQIEEMSGIVQQLMDQGSAKQIDAQAKILSAQIKGQSDILAAKEKAMGDITSTQISSETGERVSQLRHQISLIDSRLKAEKNDIARGELLLQKEALVHKMLMEEPNIGVSPGNDEGKQMSDVLMNDKYGKIPGAEG